MVCWWEASCRVCVHPGLDYEVIFILFFGVFSYLYEFHRPFTWKAEKEWSSPY